MKLTVFRLVPRRRSSRFRSTSLSPIHFWWHRSILHRPFLDEFDVDFCFRWNRAAQGLEAEGIGNISGNGKQFASVGAEKVPVPSMLAAPLIDAAAPISVTVPETVIVTV